MYMSITKLKSYNNAMAHVIINIMMVESWLILPAPDARPREKKRRNRKDKQTFCRTRTPTLDKSSRIPW